MAALQVRNFEYVCCERNYFDNGFAFCAVSDYGGFVS